MRKIRVVIAKPGLDGHDRGAKVVARALVEAGMEVVYLGLRQTPESIVAAAIELSHRLDLTVVAEGVETEEQYRCLEELGCDLIQGYLVSRPVPAATLSEVVDTAFQLQLKTHAA